MNFPGRPRSELRNQLVLNLARDDVKDYIFGFLDKLATDYKIRYFKWDMNRTFAEPGWPEVAPTEQRELWVKYVWNYYDIMDRLRKSIPIWRLNRAREAAAASILGVLRYVDEVWTSDNTEAFDRLRFRKAFRKLMPQSSCRLG